MHSPKQPGDHDATVRKIKTPMDFISSACSILERGGRYPKTAEAIRKAASDMNAENTDQAMQLTDRDHQLRKERQRVAGLENELDKLKTDLDYAREIMIDNLYDAMLKAGIKRGFGFEDKHRILLGEVCEAVVRWKIHGESA